jgi:hypothetical protein
MPQPLKLLDAGSSPAASSTYALSSNGKTVASEATDFGSNPNGASSYRDSRQTATDKSDRDPADGKRLLSPIRGCDSPPHGRCLSMIMERL